jgi:soluble lytic murein transglycosylase-like protein
VWKINIVLFTIAIIINIIAIDFSNAESTTSTYQIDSREIRERIKDREEVEQKKQEEVKSTYYDIPLSEDIQDYIFQISNQYDIPSNLIIALVDIETGGTFDNTLRSKNDNGSSDWGLCQLNSYYHDYFGDLIGEKDFDAGNAYHNLHAGVAYLSVLRDSYKGEYTNYELMTRYLNSYNMGVAGYKRYIEDTGKISRSYSERILSKKEDYKLLK